jgi:hypothetical protein
MWPRWSPRECSRQSRVFFFLGPCVCGCVSWCVCVCFMSSSFLVYAFVREERLRGIEVEERGAARCIPNNCNQSLKIRGGGSAGFMRGGGREHKKEVVGGAMPLPAGRGVMPLGGAGGVILPRQRYGAMLSRGSSRAIALGATGGGVLPRRRRQCDAATRRRQCDAVTRRQRCNAVA